MTYIVVPIVGRKYYGRKISLYSDLLSLYFNKHLITEVFIITDVAELIGQ